MNRLWGIYLLMLASWMHSAEPVYQGKSESYWINTLTNKAAVDALTNLGQAKEIILLKASVVQESANAALVRSNAEAALKEWTNPEVITSLASSDDDSEIRRLAIRHLVGWLQHTNRTQRWLGANYIGDCPPCWDTAYAELRKALSNRDQEIRHAAATALRARDGLRDFEEVLTIYAEELEDAVYREDGSGWQVTIRVVDEKGLPIPSAEVWIMNREKRAWESADPSGASARWADFGRTDADGRFQFRRLRKLDSSFQVKIHARKTGYVSASIGCNPPKHPEDGGPPLNRRIVPEKTLVLKRQ